MHQIYSNIIPVFILWHSMAFALSKKADVVLEHQFPQLSWNQLQGNLYNICQSWMVTNKWRKKFYWETSKDEVLEWFLNDGGPGN